MNLEFVLDLVYFLPQILANAWNGDRLSSISLLTQSLMVFMFSMLMVYAIGTRLPAQYVIPPTVALCGLGLQEVQIWRHWRELAGGRRSSAGELAKGRRVCRRCKSGSPWRELAGGKAPVFRQYVQ